MTRQDKNGLLVTHYTSDKNYFIKYMNMNKFYFKVSHSYL